MPRHRDDLTDEYQHAYTMKMEALEYIRLDCPYCGAKNKISVERVADSVTYTEDCQACCCAMLVNVRICGDDMAVSVQREDD